MLISCSLDLFSRQCPGRRHMQSYTLAAHLVTLRPSFKHSVSPLPYASVLHFMKSSLKGRHLAPMKKDALIKGAEVAPISLTAGMFSGIGVVSSRTDCENLHVLFSAHSLCCDQTSSVPCFSSRHDGGVGCDLANEWTLKREGCSLSHLRAATGCRRSCQ